MTGSARIEPARRFEIACQLAGVLAESGVTRLTLHRADQQIPLDTRSTDLPAMLADGSIDLIGDGLLVRFAADSVHWEARSDELARRICAVCA